MLARECEALLQSAELTLRNATKLLNESRTLAEPAGFCIDVSSILATEVISNTDHIILQAGEAATDHIEELKRRFHLRLRAQIPESRGEGRWDKPKKIGERRRKIVQPPEAPPIPPPAAYVIFLIQMTAKIRHDRGPNETHNQSRVLPEISAIWRSALNDSERDYYAIFHEETKAEYQKQLLEYRATGRYKMSETFDKIEGTNIWVRKQWHEKNAIERELAGYESFTFLPRPPDEEEAYQKRSDESKERRKRKLRQENMMKKLKRSK